MRITEIEIKGLFGIFNHRVPLNLDERTTIITGPNGLGKTVLLRMVDGLLTSQTFKFRRIPFDEFRLDFEENKSSLSVVGSIAAECEFDDIASSSREMEYRFKEKGKRARTHKVPRPKIEDGFRSSVSMIEDEVWGLERTGPRAWRYNLTGETLDLEDIYERFGDQLHQGLVLGQNDPDWLKKLRESTPVRLIETQRLLERPSGPSVRSRTFYRTSRALMKPSVAVYSEELALAIQSKLAESAELSQDLDRTFPRRVMSQETGSQMKSSELQVELDRLEEKRRHLIEVGLLDAGQQSDLGLIGEIDDEMLGVLSIYVRDTERKLSIFDDMASRIDLLRRMINSRFLYKELNFSREQGFVFTNPHGEEVPVIGLSSGEQHRLVLLYELLFRVREGSLILIDEPELSLHVVWQEGFLKDVQDIARNRNFDVVIATHSPQIINTRWDLVVELKGP